jgi:hypothetical protein
MPDPISATGAVRNPTRYGALTENARDFTGLWTQRSPYHDAAVPYLVSKFYSGSRFDGLDAQAKLIFLEQMTNVGRTASRSQAAGQSGAQGRAS